MGQDQEKGDLVILKRFLTYVGKTLGISSCIEKIRDLRLEPKYPTGVIVRSVIAMFLARMGSLNALEQTKLSKAWQRWLGDELPSADTLGRVAACTDLDTVREALQDLYTQLKRNKTLPPKCGGLTALVLDGHEMTSSYKRRCSGCLQRTKKTRDGQQIQYYHHCVYAMLLCGNFPIFLDLEPIRPGGDERAAAHRLLERLLKQYPRAFDIVLGDAMYADAKIANLLLDHGKDLLAVLKANNPTLLEDFRALSAGDLPGSLKRGKASCETWDHQGFTTWLKVKGTVRVVRSRETRYVRRQLTGAVEKEISDCTWVTTLSRHRATTETVIRLGHARWDIENLGFNETVNRWHTDHVYKHDPTAILVFSLLAMMAFNVFQAFYFRNLKPQMRARRSRLHIAEQVASDIYAAILPATARAP